MTMFFSRNPFRPFFKIRLTKGERVAVRENLVIFMQQYPLPATLSEKRVHAPMLVRPVAITFAILVVVISSGVGISYAAERSLPGSPLYAIKINVNENVRSALAQTPQAQAQLTIDRIDRRLEEAEQLIAQGRLDAKTSVSLANSISEQTHTAEQKVQQATQEKRTLDAAALQADLRATLNAHTNLIHSITSGDDNDEEIEKLLAQALAVPPAPLTYEDAESADAETDAGISLVVVPIAAGETQGKKQTAEKKLNAAHKQFSRASVSLDENTALQVKELLTEAQNSHVQANTVLDAGNHEDAFGLYQKTDRLAQEAKHLINARSKLANTKFNYSRSGKKKDIPVVAETVATTTKSQATSGNSKKERSADTRAGAAVDQNHVEDGP